MKVKLEMKRKKIIFAPYPKPRTDGKMNAKSYPYWQEVVDELSVDFKLIQIVHGNEHPFVASSKNCPNEVEHLMHVKFKEIEHLVEMSDTFLCVDNYLQHVGHYVGNTGVVLFGPSDPKLFGYSDNVNLFASEKYFRPHQFQTWNEWEYRKDAFVGPDVVISAVREKLGYGK